MKAGIRTGFTLKICFHPVSYRFNYNFLRFCPRSKAFLPNGKSLFDLGQKDIRRRSKALWLYSLTIKVWQLPLYDTFRTRLIYKCQLFTFIDNL